MDKGKKKSKITIRSRTVEYLTYSIATDAQGEREDEE